MKHQFAAELIDFIHSGCTPYHAVEQVKFVFVRQGFKLLDLSDSWHLEAGGKYFVTQNDSSLFAWIQGFEKVRDAGYKIIAAHTDSPSLKIKPQPQMLAAGCLKLNVEVYGGPILYTWFDRPLSLAGRVLLRTEDVMKPQSCLVNMQQPLLIIPHLAIHLDRSVNEGHHLSRQKEFLPIFSQAFNGLEYENYLLYLLAKEINVSPSHILDFDLVLYEFNKGILCGANNEFISSGRLDDLAMVHAALNALTHATPCQSTCVLALFDNEEVGSASKQGAGSPILSSILKRIALSDKDAKDEDYSRAINQSFLISADMAHALHPNYEEKSDPTNRPLMNGGPVIKINANQKYISDAYSSAVFRGLCEQAGVPCQQFVNHSDTLGGSTLGHVLMSQMEIKGVDIGNPMWAMHSICETAGVQDHTYIIEVFKQYFT